MSNLVFLFAERNQKYPIRQNTVKTCLKPHTRYSIKYFLFPFRLMTHTRRNMAAPRPWNSKSKFPYRFCHIKIFYYSIIISTNFYKNVKFLPHRHIYTHKEIHTVTGLIIPTIAYHISDKIPQDELHA